MGTRTGTIRRLRIGLVGVDLLDHLCGRCNYSILLQSAVEIDHPVKDMEREDQIAKLEDTYTLVSSRRGQLRQLGRRYSVDDCGRSLHCLHRNMDRRKRGKPGEPSSELPQGLDSLPSNIEGGQRLQCRNFPLALYSNQRTRNSPECFQKERSMVVLG